MGYRSDVTAVFYVSEEKNFGVLKLWPDANFPMDAYNDEIRWFDRGMVVECENVKWYSDYAEVMQFNVAVSKFQ